MSQQCADDQSCQQSIQYRQKQAGFIKSLKNYVEENFGEKSKLGRYILKECIPSRLSIYSIQKVDSILDKILKLQNVHIQIHPKEKTQKLREVKQNQDELDQDSDSDSELEDIEQNIIYHVKTLFKLIKFTAKITLEKRVEDINRFFQSPQQYVRDFTQAITIQDTVWDFVKEKISFQNLKNIQEQIFQELIQLIKFNRKGSKIIISLEKNFLLKLKPYYQSLQNSLVQQQKVRSSLYQQCLENYKLRRLQKLKKYNKQIPEVQIELQDAKISQFQQIKSGQEIYSTSIQQQQTVQTNLPQEINQKKQQFVQTISLENSTQPSDEQEILNSVINNKIELNPENSFELNQSLNLNDQNQIQKQAQDDQTAENEANQFGEIPENDQNESSSIQEQKQAEDEDSTQTQVVSKKNKNKKKK